MTGRARGRSAEEDGAAAARVATGQERLELGQAGLQVVNTLRAFTRTKAERRAAGRLGTESRMVRSSASEGLQPAQRLLQVRDPPRGGIGTDRRGESRAEHRGSDQCPAADGIEKLKPLWVVQSGMTCQLTCREGRERVIVRGEPADQELEGGW